MESNETINILKAIATNKKKEPIQFDEGHELSIDPADAKALVDFYKLLKSPSDRNKFEEGIGSSAKQFLFLLDYALK